MEDRSSRTSIIVALVAIVLIVGGIFLLNQSISGGQNDNEDEGDQDVVIVTPEAEEPDPTNFEECQEAGGFITQGPPEECTFNGQTFVKETTNDEPNPDENTDDQDPTDDPNQEDPTEDPDQDSDPTEPTTPDEDEDTSNDVTLTSDEFTAKLTSINGNETNYTIVESGFENSRWVKAGAPMRLVGISSSFNVNLQVGQVYKFKADISENSEGFQINRIQSVTQVS
jgi:hypothetical protein